MMPFQGFKGFLGGSGGRCRFKGRGWFEGVHHMGRFQVMRVFLRSVALQRFLVQLKRCILALYN